MMTERYKNIVEGQIDTSEMTKADRAKELNSMFRKVRDCMIHNADNNNRPVFCLLVTAQEETV